MPSFLAYEPSNVACGKALRHAYLRGKSAYLWASTGPEANHTEVLKLALDTGPTTYDLSYLHLALAFDGRLAA